jgi:hypothetical protein
MFPAPSLNVLLAVGPITIIALVIGASISLVLQKFLPIIPSIFIDLPTYATAALISRNWRGIGLNGNQLDEIGDGNDCK